MKSFVALAVLVATAVAAEHMPHDARMHRRSLQARGPILDRRAPVPQGGIIPDLVGGNGTTTAESTTTTTTTSSAPTTTSSSSTRRPDPPPVTTTPTTTSDTTTSTSTTSTSTTSTTSTSTTRTTTPIPTIPGDNTSTTQNTVLSFATARTTTVRGSTSSSAPDPTDISTSGSSFSQNKAAVAATATVAALVALGALVFLAFWWKKKADRGKMGEEDMWDEASMKEFSRRPVSPGPVVPPPVAMRNVDLESEMSHYSSDAGLGRSNTKVLPSQSSGSAALARSRSHHAQQQQYHQQDTYEEPDELLAMPPVAHYERPRDSAYDIVPAPPPVSAYAQPSQGYGYSNAAASGSRGGGGLVPPTRKGDHTSFGSGLGNDPFAGSGFVDANRESTFGPGQAGRGAGGAAAAGGMGHDAGVVANQWPQGYNPYTGYSQGSQAPYGAGYGYAS